MTPLFVILGSQRRTPHEYRAVDRLTHQSKQCLRNTHEYVHSSVRIRMGLHGYGYNDKGNYDAYGLRGWTMEGIMTPNGSISSDGIPSRQHSGAMTDVKWVKKDSSGNGGDPALVMPEDTLGDLERLVMRSWPQVEKRFDSIKPGSHAVKLYADRKEALRALRMPDQFKEAMAKQGGGKWWKWKKGDERSQGEEMHGDKQGQNGERPKQPSHARQRRGFKRLSCKQTT